MEIERELKEFEGAVRRIKEQIALALVGQERVVEEVLICLLARGHVLLEGAPGLGKTLLVRTLAQCLDLRFSRIQFTPDLMPADITGTNVIFEEPGGKKSFRFQKGPLFGNVILADEINRATPKTQSALLEAMQECAVTVAGTRHVLKPPFFVLATQNPIEMEGTYPLPEAQLDRFFFKVLVDSPDETTLVEILDTTTGTGEKPVKPVLDAAGLNRFCALVREVPLAKPLAHYIARLVRSTQPSNPESNGIARRYVRYGAGVRGAQALALGAKVHALFAGRPNVAFEDIRAVAAPALRHRLLLNFEGEAEGVVPDRIVAQVLEDEPEVPPAVTGLG